MTDAEKAALEKSPLGDRLIALIKARGPITIADYMADALGHPHDGYYSARPAIGAAGDFTTAPEISQVFGELIGVWLVQSWLEMGSPSSFNLVELGPGRGVLMSDVLRASAIRPGFSNAASVMLVEASGRLRHDQERRLRATSAHISWADSFSECAGGPTLVIANEFFDCLPIRQFVRSESGWRERLVGLDDTGEGLAFTLAATPPEATPLPDKKDVAVGSVIEISDASASLASEIAQHLQKHTGRALIIDYGHAGHGSGDTLQAVRNHAFWPPLSAPGLADLTAHVDFAAISRAAVENGVGVHGPATQGAFLQRMGLTMRVEALAAGKNAEGQAEIHAGALRLASERQMGSVFKALCLSSHELPPPPGFETP
ncbi:MAG: SAM-dependent methyltransferase [Pseudomonadota bacterium]